MLAKNSLEGKAESFVERIERLVDEIESARGTYMAKAKELREDIKEVKVEAKDNGVLTKALKAVLKERELQRKIAALGANLDIDEGAQFSQLSEALGGPMGEWAKRRAEAADDGERDLRGTQQRQTEKERKESDPEAMKKLGRGNDAAAATH
jgi:uncharacterized protein (UPF0335 family)